MPALPTERPEWANRRRAPPEGSAVATALLLLVALLAVFWLGQP